MKSQVKMEIEMLKVELKKLRKCMKNRKVLVLTVYPKIGREHFIVDYGKWKALDFNRYSHRSNLDIEFAVKMESELPTSVHIDEKMNDFAERYGCEVCALDLSGLMRDLPFESILNKVEGKPYLFGDWTSKPSDFKPKQDSK